MTEQDTPAREAQPDSAQTGVNPLAIVSLVLGVGALILTFTLARFQAPWALAVAAGAIITGILTRGNGVWLARAGILAGIIAAICLIVWLNT